MKKRLIFGSMFVVILMIMAPNVNAFNYNRNNIQNARVGIALAIGKVNEFYENDTHYVINWLDKGAFVFQWDNVEGLFIGLYDKPGVQYYSKENYTFIGITNINFFIIFAILHDF